MIRLPRLFSRPVTTPGSTRPGSMLASRLHVRRARGVDVSAGSLGKTAELALGRASNSPASCRIPAHLTSTPEARDCRTCEDRDARMTIPPLMAVQGRRDTAERVTRREAPDGRGRTAVTAASGGVRSGRTRYSRPGVPGGSHRRKLGPIRRPIEQVAWRQDPLQPARRPR